MLRALLVPMLLTLSAGCTPKAELRNAVGSPRYEAVMVDNDIVFTLVNDLTVPVCLMAGEFQIEEGDIQFQMFVITSGGEVWNYVGDEPYFFDPPAIATVDPGESVRKVYGWTGAYEPPSSFSGSASVEWVGRARICE